jgi:hypothetical protein
MVRESTLELLALWLLLVQDLLLVLSLSQAVLLTTPKAVFG